MNVVPVVKARGFLKIMACSSIEANYYKYITDLGGKKKKKKKTHTQKKPTKTKNKNRNRNR